MNGNVKKLFTWCLVISLVITQTVFSTAAFAQSTQVKRLSGSDRYKTAVAISQNGWSKGSPNAVLARGDDFADALCAGPLAKKLGAPILLTQPEELNADTLNEIKRLKVKNLYIVGGVGAVSQKVEDTLKAEGIKVERIWGSDRYETSVKIAEKIGTSSNLVLATGDNFPDALSISAVAADQGMPILLTGKDSLPGAVSQYIKGKQIAKTYVIGGTGVISDVVKNLVPNAVRLGGKDRYETNTLVMQEFASKLNFNKLYVAVGDGPNGNEFADALAGAVLAARTLSPIILVYNTLADTTANFIKSKISFATKVIALGGEAVVPSEIVTSIMAFKDSLPVQAKYDKAGTYGPATGVETVSGNVVISAADVNLQNMVINGDLVLAESIGDGNVSLKNLTVKGTTIINGGGPNSVIMYNFNGQTVIVDVPDGSSVRLVAQGSTNINNVIMESDGKLEESNLTGNGFINVVIPEDATVTLQGSFNTVDVQAGGADVTLASGSINTLNVNDTATNSNIILASGTNVSTLIVNAAASIGGTGTIQTAHIASNWVSIAQTPGHVTRAEGVTEGTVGNRNVSDFPVSSTPQTGGSSGGDSGGYTGDTTAPTITSLTGGAQIIGNNIVFPGPTYDISGATFRVSENCTLKIQYSDTDTSPIILGQWNFNSGVDNQITITGNVAGLNLANVLAAVIDAGIGTQDIADSVNFKAILTAVQTEVQRDPSSKKVIYDDALAGLFNDLKNAAKDKDISKIYEAINLPLIYSKADDNTKNKIERALENAAAVYVVRFGGTKNAVVNELVSDKSSKIIENVNTSGDSDFIKDFYDAINFTILRDALVNAPDANKTEMYKAINLTAIFDSFIASGISKLNLYLAMANAFNDVKNLATDTKESIERAIDINTLVGKMVDRNKKLEVILTDSSNNSTIYNIAKIN